MSAEEFVNIIRKVVWESAVEDIEANLADPPGRNPSKNSIEMTNWYNALNSAEKQIVQQLINESARVAVFGFLCVLDGARAIEGQEKGTLKLFYEKSGKQILLKDQKKFGLHELL